MSKASNTATTVAAAPTPGLPSTSRRRLLAGSGFATALASIGLPAAAAPSLPTVGSDPVVAFYAKWQATENAIAALNSKHVELRNAFVARYGDMGHQGSNDEGWRNDPRAGQLHGLTQALNDACDESTGFIDAMMETPATSLEGIRCKMIVGLDVWRFIERPGVEAEYHDDMTVAFLRDAARLLGGSAVA